MPDRDWLKDWELCQRIKPLRSRKWARVRVSDAMEWEPYIELPEKSVEFINVAPEGWLAALERIRELDALAGRLGTQVLEARERINTAYLLVDQYTMPQTVKPGKALLEQALKELREAAQILDEAYKEASNNA